MTFVKRTRPGIASDAPARLLLLLALAGSAGISMAVQAQNPQDMQNMPESSSLQDSRELPDSQDSREQEQLESFRVAPTPILTRTTPILGGARGAALDVSSGSGLGVASGAGQGAAGGIAGGTDGATGVSETTDFQGKLVQDALNFNLGVKITPIEGLNLQADAWRQEIEDAPALTVNTGMQGSPSALYLEDSAINEFSIDNPLLAGNLSSSGINLGASYAWDSTRFGKFTLSTKTTFVVDFENNGSLLELINDDASSLEDRVISPELQSSLMLTWQLGNHTASAITNYIDSFNDFSELNLEEINALVDNITTIDLQYGYSVETGSNNQAVISFGIRNIFDEKTAQILNSSTRILDQNGRVAYGSIKYQF